MSNPNDPDPAAEASSRAATPPRPRIWVPGVLDAVPQGHGRARLVAGPRAGLAHDALDLTDWKTEVVAVARAAALALDAPTRAELGVGASLPESLLEAGRSPGLHRLAALSPLVLLDGAASTAWAAAGLRTFTVGADRVSGAFWLRASGGGAASVDEDGTDGQYTTAEALADAGDDPADNPWSLRRPGVLDRVLRAWSGGVIDEASLVLALRLARVIDPSFAQRGGARNATVVSSTPAAVAHRALGDESLTSQVFARASQHEDDARAIAAALASAPPAADVVGVPVYGVARRTRVPAVQLLVRHQDGRAPTRGPLLPEESHWHVDDVDTWAPVIPQQLVDKLAASRPRR